MMHFIQIESSPRQGPKLWPTMSLFHLLGCNLIAVVAMIEELNIFCHVIMIYKFDKEMQESCSTSSEEFNMGMILKITLDILYADLLEKGHESSSLGRQSRF